MTPDTFFRFDPWVIKLNCVLIFLGSLFTGISQNLVPNPSFEDFTQCPFSWSLGGPLEATPWVSATQGTSDYFNACSNPSVVGVPDNFFGTQPAHTGVGYAGGYAKYTFIYREYILAPLTAPLVAGSTYYVSFYVSLADFTCGIQTMGALLTVFPPIGSGWLPLSNYVPQIESNMGYLSDKDNWTLIEGCFTAEGGESYITIGNFRNEVETTLDPACNPPVGTSYYYVDDVTVIETTPENIFLDLGDPVTVCDSYEIDPGIDNVAYFWEDGSHGPTLTVTTSGTYSLTVSTGCDSGVDSIEVIVENPDPVEIGPPQITICNGDAYAVSLDPGAGQYEWNDGSTSPDYFITTSGTYQVTLDDGCDITTDQIMVTVMDIPDPFTLGADTYICPGAEIEYYFDPSLGDFQWQDNSNSNAYLIYQEGVYSLTISNMCGEQSDEIEITALDLPDVNLGPDEEDLCSGDFIDLSLDPSAGDFVWQDGSTAPDFHITTSGLYSVTATNDCGSISDQVNILFSPVPSVDLGVNLSLCSGDTVQLSTDPFPGNYQWQDGSTSTSLSVTTSGVYTLSISNECGIDVDTVLVNFQAAVEPPDFGPDFSLCPGQQFVQYISSPGANYLWQDLSTADSFPITNAGTYYVQVYNSCSSFSDTLVVSFNDSPPQIDLPAQINLCQGDSTIVDAGISNVSYLWNDGSQNAQLNVSTPGVYSLTVSNTCGSDIDTVLVTDAGPPPSVALGNDIDICPGDVMLLSPVFSDVNSWNWQDGSSASTFTVSNAGSVSVEVNNTCGTDYDTLLVSLLPSTPSLNLGSDTSLCPGESVTLSVNTPNVSITWSDGSSNPDFIVSGAGTYSASITNGCGVSVDSVSVSMLPSAPILDLGSDQSLCPGEVINISPGIPNVNYAWQDGSTNTSFNATQEGTIILTLSNNCGSTTDSLVITESTQGPQVDLGADVLACEGDVITIAAGVSGVNYLWQDGSTSPDFVTTSSGTFILEVSNICGVDKDTIEVDIHGNSPIADLGPDTTLCEGVNLILTSSADPETSVEWQDGSSLSLFTVSSPGVYSLYESNHCGDASDTIRVSYLDAPDDFDLGPDTTLCPGQSFLLQAPTTAFDLLWQDGSIQNTILVNQASTYSLHVSNTCGIKSDELTVYFDNRTPVIDLDTSISWCEGDIITLDAAQLFDAAYLWNTGSTSSSIQVSSPGMYAVQVIIPCITSSDQAEVVPGFNCDHFNEIYIPNIFSPNGDNINDVFLIGFGSDLNIVSIDGSIFDRWGELVFNSKENPFVWDGLFGNDTLLPGVYVYVIKVKYMDQGIEHEGVFSGDITLMR